MLLLQGNTDSVSTSDESEESEDAELLVGEGEKLESFGAVKVRHHDTVRVTIPIFNVACQAVFLFGNASNHSYATDAF